MTEVRTAADYQRETSYERTTLGGGPLDWSNQPLVFKRYRNGKETPLTPSGELPRLSFSEVSAGRASADRANEITVTDLARALALGYGITAEARHGGAPFYYRSAPSAGALYPCEVYVAARGVSGLAPGLYHYQADRQVLTELRPLAQYGSIRGLLSGNGEPEPALALFVSALFFRSGWKYRKRCYRYLLLDSGHLLENLMLSLRLTGLIPEMTLDFDDHAVSRLLGIDPEREVVLAAAWLPGSEATAESAAKPQADPLQPVEPEACQMASRERSFPEVQAIHRISSRVVKASEPGPELLDALGPHVSDWTDLESRAITPGSPKPLADSIRQRRSRRNFVPRELDRAAWNSILLDLCEPGWGQATDHYQTDRAVCVGFLAERLTSLADGFYLLDRGRRRIALARSGRFLSPMAHVCLDQAWLTHAACHFLFLTRLDLTEAVWGPRAYRYALIEAGRLAQRLYLAAESQDVGACGIGAFFDREARELLGLDPAAAMTYLLGLGSIKKAL